MPFGPVTPLLERPLKDINGDMKKALSAEGVHRSTVYNSAKLKITEMSNQRRELGKLRQVHSMGG